MNISLRFVTEIPIVQLWNNEKIIEAKRERYLTKKELTEILKKYPVEFVIANVGDKLEWVPVDKCFDNWKSRIKNQVADSLDRIELESYPNEFAYIASEWTGQIQTPIILLEKCH